MGFHIFENLGFTTKDDGDLIFLFLITTWLLRLREESGLEEGIPEGRAISQTATNTIPLP